jgi:hypothetical protein
MQSAAFPKCIISLLGFLTLGIWLATSANLRAQDAASASAQPADTVTTDGAAPSDSGTTTASAPAASAPASGAAGSPSEVAPTGISGSQPDTGILNFQTDLFTGRFGYRVPIAVPPARGNSQPNIVLHYNSSGGNGWCGVGWMLDMGYIQRDTRFGVPRALTSTGPANQYDDTKGFVFSLGGVESRLIFIQNVGSDKEFHAETDNGSFLRFFWKSSDGSWQVTDKGGNNFYFGAASTTRMENPKFTGASVAQRTFRWALDRVEDVNGNKTVLTYTTVSNMLYLAQIQYNLSTKATFTANTVDFSLIDRADKTISYRPGYRVEVRKLLKDITVRAAGQDVRKYTITYTGSPSTCRSLISQVQQYGTDFASGGLPLPATKFAYQVQSNSFGALTDWPGLNSQDTSVNWNSIRSEDTDGNSKVEFTDADRDGLPDRVMRERYSPYTYFAMQRNTGTSFVFTDYFWTNLFDYGLQGDNGWNSVDGVDGSGGTQVAFIDINGDGFPDRVLRTNTAPYNVFLVQTNTGTVFSDAFTWGPVTNASTDPSWRCIRSLDGTFNVKLDFLDMNGDGLPDRVSRNQSSSPYTNFLVQINTGSGFSPLLSWGAVDTQGNNHDDAWGALYAVCRT